jgi:hypothetical protein
MGTRFLVIDVATTGSARCWRDGLERAGERHPALSALDF